MSKTKVYLSVSYKADRLLASFVERNLSLLGVTVVKYNNKKIGRLSGWDDSDTQNLKSCDLLLIVPPQEQTVTGAICIGSGQSNEIRKFEKLSKIGIMYDTDIILTPEHFVLTPPQKQDYQLDYGRLGIDCRKEYYTTLDWIRKTIPNFKTPVEHEGPTLHDVINEARSQVTSGIYPKSEMPELDKALRDLQSLKTPYSGITGISGTTSTVYTTVTNNSGFSGIWASLPLTNHPYKVAATVIATKVEEPAEFDPNEEVKPMLALYSLLRF